jgi:hypothetical protein
MSQPCTPWVTAEDVMECCSVETTDETIFESAALQASELLFNISGRLFPGECGPKTVRPPCLSCSCGYQVLSRGYVIGPWDWGGYPLWGMCDICLVSCAPSLVKLSGYPVRFITEVLIDGDVVDPADYRIFKQRYAMRLDDGRWPIRQDLTLADTEDGTFSISYTYGADPPEMGVAAAAQLGCELYKACGDAGANCALPTGVTRITRQGITVDRLAFTSWAFREGRWQTGLSLVDAFLAMTNPAGIIRRPTIYAPGKRQYAQRWG